MPQIKTRFILVTLLIAISGILLGCRSPRLTEPKRTGIEQLLLSSAVDGALSDVELPLVDGKMVYLSGEYLESYDSRYVLGTIRAVLSENGSHLTDDPEEADIIVEARSGALGIDSSSDMFGIPAIPIVIPTAGTVSLPDLSLYKAQKSDAISKLALLAYDADSGAPIFSSETYPGKSHFHKYTVLFLFDINFTDIRERKGF